MLPAAIVLAVALVLGLLLPLLMLGRIPDALLVAIGAAGAALIATRPARSTAPAPAPPPPPAATPAPTPVFLRELRHDLRGILSPAMMLADRLLMTTQDPLARRCAETMIETIERTERRLSGTEQPAPQDGGHIGTPQA